MLPRLIARLRRHRGLAVLLAVALLGLQAFVAGLAMAQAAVLLTPDSGAGFAVICHGNSGPAPEGGSAPAPAKDWHPCCVACAAGAGAAVLPVPWAEPSLKRQVAATAPRPRAALVLIASRAVRAGPSQAPPPSFD